ncbi:MAG: hypothetical protein ACKVU4_08570 [Phycisphaerales bacterium]
MTDRPASNRPKWLQILHAALVNPIATVALALLLCADAASIANRYGHRSRSAIVDSLCDVLPFVPPRVRWTPAAQQRWVSYGVREPSGLRLIDPDNDSWDEATKLLAERPDDVITFTFRHSSWKKGLWAVSRETTRTHFEFMPMGADFTAEEKTTLRRLIVEQVLLPRELIDASIAPALIASDLESEKTIWSGRAHTSFALLAFLALVYSLCWVPRAPSWLRERRIARALACGRCPTCGYNILGLPGFTCPECGKPIP